MPSRPVECEVLVFLMPLAVKSGVKKWVCLSRVIVCCLCKLCLSLRLCESLLILE